jgi:hypothetical protein
MFFYSEPGEPEPQPTTQIVQYVTMSLNALADASNTGSYPGSGSVWYNLLNPAQAMHLVNGTVFTESNGVKSMRLDGVNDYIAVPFLNPSTVNQAPNTITFWAKRNNNEPGILLSNLYGRWIFPGSFYRAHGYQISLTTGPSASVGFFIQDGNGNFYGGGSVNGTIPNDGKFYNITIRNRIEIFINGVNTNAIVGSARGTPDFNFLSSQEFRIGSNRPNTNNWFLAGNVAAFQFYDRALTDQEIAFNFSGSKGSFNW